MEFERSVRQCRKVLQKVEAGECEVKLFQDYVKILDSQPLDFQALFTILQGLQMKRTKTINEQNTPQVKASSNRSRPNSTSRTKQKKLTVCTLISKPKPIKKIKSLALNERPVVKQTFLLLSLGTSNWEQACIFSMLLGMTYNLCSQSQVNELPIERQSIWDLYLTLYQSNSTTKATTILAHVLTLCVHKQMNRAIRRMLQLCQQKSAWTFLHAFYHRLFHKLSFEKQYHNAVGIPLTIGRGTFGACMWKEDGGWFIAFPELKDDLYLIPETSQEISPRLIYEIANQKIKKRDNVMKYKKSIWQTQLQKGIAKISQNTTYIQSVFHFKQPKHQQSSRLGLAVHFYK